MLAALAGDPEISTCPVDVVELQTGGLASTQAKPNQDHDDRPVPCPECGGRIAHPQHGRDLIAQLETPTGLEGAFKRDPLLARAHARMQAAEARRESVLESTPGGEAAGGE